MECSSAVTNRTFVDYVNTVRLEKAKELLLATDEPTYYRNQIYQGR